MTRFRRRSIDRRATSGSQPRRADYIREVEWIAFGGDSTASARDRVSALNTLLKLDPGSAGVTHVTMNCFLDEDGNPTLRPPSRTAAVDDAESSPVASPESDAVD